MLRNRSFSLMAVMTLLLFSIPLTTSATGTTQAMSVKPVNRFLPVASISAPNVIPSQRGNWHLVFNEEFKGPHGAAPDPAIWTYDVGNNNGWGNNEEEYYTSTRQNSFLTGNGGLEIVARKQQVGGDAYTSARLESKVSFRYGYIQVDAKLPQGGQGIWPAIWLLPTNNTYGIWPASGEIDMMEAINSMTRIHGDLHYGNMNVPDLGIWYNKRLSPGFHVYAIKWGPNRIRYYVDGHLYLTFTSKQWTNPAVGPTPAPFDQPFHLMLNIACGGNWPGNVAASTHFPQTMTIRYIRVYQRDASYAWPLPGIIQADRTSVRSPDMRIGMTTNDLQYDPNVVPQPSDNLASLAPDHTLVWKRRTDVATYRVDVTQSGTYTLIFRYASKEKGHLLLHIDNHALFTASIGKSNGWNQTTMHVPLTKGIHVLQVQSTNPQLRLHYLLATRND